MAVALIDRQGEYLHRSPCFLKMTSGTDAVAALQSAVRTFERRSLLEAARSERCEGGPETVRSMEVRTGSATYRVHALVPEESPSEGEVALLVIIEHLRRPAEREVPAKYRLTPREARVAQLLAEGRTNKEISAELGIRPTTAKNHTQVVLRKLGLQRRSQVGPLLRPGLAG